MFLSKESKEGCLDAQRKLTSASMMLSGQKASGRGQNPVGTLVLGLGFTKIIFVTLSHLADLSDPFPGGGVTPFSPSVTARWFAAYE